MPEPAPKPKPDHDFRDWESIMWFLVSHILQIADAHERRLDELKSTVEIKDPELFALTESYVELYASKLAFREKLARNNKTGSYTDDPDWQLLDKRTDRAAENFKQRISKY